MWYNETGKDVETGAFRRDRQCRRKELLMSALFQSAAYLGGGILLVILAPSVLVLLMGSITAVLFDLVHYLGRRRRLP